MARKSKEVRGKLGGHLEPFDVLEEIETRAGRELSGKAHDLAEKPIKRLRRARSAKEAYRCLHRK